MNLFVNKLSMDLMQPQTPPAIYAVQGEHNTRCVELALFYNGEPWNIPDDVSLSVRYKKPDLKGGIYDTLSDGASALSYKSNTITAIFVPQMLTVPGAVLAQIEMRKEDAVLSTFTFHIVVESNPAAGVLASEDYVNMLQWMEKELDVYVKKIREDGDVLGGTMLGPINMNGQTLSGLHDPTQNDHAANMGYVNRQARKAVPHNLLDNSDFTNPVNQRGKMCYTGKAYSIDRWRAFHADTIHEVTADGIKVSSTGANSNIYQALDTERIDTTKTLTAAACDSDGAIYIWTGIKDVTPMSTIGVYTSGSRVLFRLNRAKTWKWAALYYGEYTADTLPEYQPKGFAAELRECQRYYMTWEQGHYIGVAMAEDESNATVILPIHQMRVYPTITFEGLTLWPNNIPIKSAYYGQMNGQMSTIVVTTNNAALNSCDIHFLQINQTGYFTLSADL